MKECKRCQVTKDLAEYHVNREAKDGKQSTCKPCRNKGNSAPAMAWAKANPEKIKVNTARYRFLKKQKKAETQT